MSRPPMSMEALLDEERLEVLALLEGTAARNKGPGSTGGARSPSPYSAARSPVRSMLDFGDEPSPPLPASNAQRKPGHLAPVRSMLDFDAPAPSRPQHPSIRSMLDVAQPSSPSAAKTSFSAQTSPTESVTPRAHSMSGAAHPHPRSLSDAASRPADFGPRASISHPGQLDPTAGYQFSGIITNNSGHALPKRVTQGGMKRSAMGNAMAEVMGGRDVTGLMLPGERGRNYSVSSAGSGGGGGGSSHSKAQKSKSPGARNRLGMRSQSPGTSLLARRLSPAGRALMDETQSMDMQNAYRRLSDANLARSGGSLSILSRNRKRSDDANTIGRLAKDYLSPDGDILPEDSSDDGGGTSSDEEGERGRKAARSFEKSPGSDNGSVKGPTNRTSHSLLAAAEEERLEVASSKSAYQYRSLLEEPQITVTNPAGERAKYVRSVIHPATSFDNSGSGTRTPIDSDTELDFSDIKRAQKLSFSMTPIMSAGDSHRSIRLIYRGEFAKTAQDAEAEHRRLKKYLVATDLSEESTHALEWTIGTVLRDGDTMIALMCVDEETAMFADSNTLVPDEPRAMKEQAAAIQAVANLKSSVGLGGGGSHHDNHHHQGSGVPQQPSGKPSPLARAIDLASVNGGASQSRERSKAEEERERAIQDITERITKLLRKTRLQVRVIIEVLHCKNPKHLITEVIDLVSPTLVILGSRGRSALKGVILGSFSNYLVTKSSVPVMVARKRLRKQSKYKGTHVPQVNNLTNPTARSLAMAKVD